jgi:thiol:disulfide interchange protein DsbA
MDCQRVDTILNEHLLSALDKNDAAAVAAHIDSCARCAEACRGHQLVAQDLPAEPRAGFYDSVRAQALGVSVARARREPARWIWPAAGLAAAAVVVLVLAAVVLPGMRVSPAEIAPAATASTGTPAVLETPALRGFVADVDYLALATPIPTSTGAGMIEVCEFFMFTCSHCFDLEPLIVAWEGRQPENVALVRVPVLWDELRRLHAQAFYTAEALGRLDEIIEPMFTEIHERGNALASANEIRAFFVRQGIGGDEFDRAFNSRSVENSLRRAAELNRQYGIASTPTLAVNGRYVTDPGRAGSHERMLDVVDALVAAEAAERCEEANTDVC